MHKRRGWLIAALATGVAGAAFTAMLARHEPERLAVAVADDDELQARPSFAVLGDGSLLHLDVGAPVVVGGDLQLGATLSLQTMAAPSTSLLFALDMSGSTLGEGQGCGGDFNGDGLVDTILD